jgi:PTH1 family peptidyl-tRNA hydrolase
MLHEEKTLLVKPLTFMNNSGQAIGNIVYFYELDLKDILVIHDDVDLELGTFKHTQSSRSAGQRGVQNIIDTLGTQDFPRLRIGIGPVAEPMSTHDFVLQKFSQDEIQTLHDIQNTITNAIEETIS